MAGIEAGEVEAMTSRPDALEAGLGGTAIVGVGVAAALPEGLAQKIAMGVSGIAFVGFTAKLWYDSNGPRQPKTEASSNSSAE